MKKRVLKKWLHWLVIYPLAGILFCNFIHQFFSSYIGPKNALSTQNNTVNLIQI